jgi:Protein of unknown function (DUF3168)
MSDAGWAIQTAIFTALNGNIGAGVSVYNHVPQNAAYPYVVIDGCEIVSDDYFTERKSTYNVYLSVWSQYNGNRQVLDIISAIDTALHRKKLTLTFGSMVNMIIARKRCKIDADGITYMGAVSLNIIVEN